MYRNTDDIVIAGVCSGIASYFDVDAVIIRFVFFASIFVGGSAEIYYIGKHELSEKLSAGAELIKRD